MLTSQVTDVLVNVFDGVVLPRYGGLASEDVQAKAPGDLVTIADREAEAELTAWLRAVDPGATVVGGAAGGRNRQLVVRRVVDQVGELARLVVIRRRNLAAGSGVDGFDEVVDRHRGGYFDSDRERTGCSRRRQIEADEVVGGDGRALVREVREQGSAGDRQTHRNRLDANARGSRGAAEVGDQDVEIEAADGEVRAVELGGVSDRVDLPTQGVEVSLESIALVGREAVSYTHLTLPTSPSV